MLVLTRASQDFSLTTSSPLYTMDKPRRPFNGIGKENDLAQNYQDNTMNYDLPFRHHPLTTTGSKRDDSNDPFLHMSMKDEGLLRTQSPTGAAARLHALRSPHPTPPVRSNSTPPEPNGFRFYGDIQGAGGTDLLSKQLGGMMLNDEVYRSTSQTRLRHLN